MTCSLRFSSTDIDGCAGVAPVVAKDEDTVLALVPAGYVDEGWAKGLVPAADASCPAAVVLGLA
jgi:hypothetical protein